MRPAVLLAQLALWASSTHAFYPYDPEWRQEAEAEKRSELSGDKRSVGDDGVRFEVKQRTVKSNRPVSERAANEAVRLATKYAGRYLPAAPADGGRALAKRANKFSIQEADEPSGKLRAGIDQDGTDYSYFVEVGLGSKQKKMYMLVDTGAGSSWVMGTNCKSEACGLHNTFGSSDSTTLDVSTETFSIAYGSGKVSGVLANDTFNLAGMSFKYQIGIATTTSDQFVSFAFDGILGFSLNTGANQNFLDAVSSSHSLDQNIFCVALNRAADGTNKGEISFGSTNKDKFTGDISYTSLQDGDDWAIKVDDFAYDGKKANAGGIPSYIDTGTSFIFGPSSAVTALHSIIPGAQSTDNATWTVPCDSSKNLTISFSGVSYQISAKDWISPKSKSGTCTSNIYGHEVVKGSWLLGDTFLKNVYAVFDKDKRRIGFAKNAVTATSTSSAKSASTTASATATTRVSALPDTTASADLGLGKESMTTSTASADASKATATQGSAAPGRPLAPASYTFVFCIISFFVLLA